MTSQKVLLYLIIVLLSLGLICLLFPKDGLNIFGIQITMPTLEEIFSFSSSEYADVESVVSTCEQKPSVNQADSTQDSSVVSFEYESVLRERFDSLFSRLDRAKAQEGVVRIVHYGDSQVEADRITGTIRKDLQKNFGGRGQGWISLFSRSTIRGVSFHYSPNWAFCCVLEPKRGLNRYGIGLSSIKALADSVSQTATVEMAFATKPAGNIVLYCASPETEGSVIISNGQDEISQVQIDASFDVQRIVISSDSFGKVLKLQATSGVELYGMNVSSNSGVLVDNISLRGSSGWGIRGSNASLLQHFYSELGVDMIIMQFGVNAIPQEKGKVIEDYTFYKKEFAKQLRFLQAMAPEALIVVVGVSDRSIKKSGKYVTNPNVLKLRQAQRQAALENGCVFWDLFEAMGGENSMPAWVLREEPLANKDFIHFNEKGAAMVAEMFLKSFYKEYKRYKDDCNMQKIR